MRWAGEKGGLCGACLKQEASLSLKCSVPYTQ